MSRAHFEDGFGADNIERKCALSKTPSKPFFRAEQVGSLLRPPRLRDARAQFAEGVLSKYGLRDIEDECIAEAVAMQEDIGLPIVTDGEFRRTVWWGDFIGRMPGIRIGGGDEFSAFRGKDGKPTSYFPRIVETVGPIRHGQPIMEHDFDTLTRCAHVVPKVTIPAPSRIHFHGGRAAIDPDVYPDLDQFWSDVIAFYRAEISALEAQGCRYIQIDDPVLSYFLEDRHRERLTARGEDWRKTLATYIRAVNESIALRKPDTLVALHICRGNGPSYWAATGDYARIAEEIFPKLEVDLLLLEYDDERSGDFIPLKLVPMTQRVVLGLISSKSEVLEGRDQLKRRLEAANRVIPLERCALSPQCGFASGADNVPFDFQRQTEKLRLVVDLAREIWGTV